jgi:hypothetical protein
MSSTNLHSPLDRPGGLSEKSRALSANTLRDRLSKLTTPLNVVYPVAALHANIKYIFPLRGITYRINYYFSFVQFRPNTNTEETEVADACGRRVVCDDSYNNMCMAPVMVCLPLYTFVLQLQNLTCSLL